MAYEALLFRFGALVCRSPAGAELFLEHVHEQPIPPFTLRSALILAHDPDPTKAHPLVSADGSSVVRCRIDREPMVAALLKEIAGKDPERFCAQALPMAGCSEIDVHARVAIHRVVLLMVLDSAYDLLPLYLNDEGVVCFYELLSYLLLDVGATPPPDDLWFGSDLKEPMSVLGAAGAQQHTLSSQNDHLDPTLLSATESLVSCSLFGTEHLPQQIRKGPEQEGYRVGAHGTHPGVLERSEEHT